jgi:hypothetical protein
MINKKNKLADINGILFINEILIKNISKLKIN